MITLLLINTESTHSSVLILNERIVLNDLKRRDAY